MGLPGHICWDVKIRFISSLRTLPKGLTPTIRKQLQVLQEQVTQKKESYKNEKGRYTSLMLLAAPTIIIPVTYYLIAGLIIQNLPINKQHRCDTLNKLINSIQQLGIAIRHNNYEEYERISCYMKSKFRKLYNHFGNELSDEIEFLLKAYKLYRKIDEKTSRYLEGLEQQIQTVLNKDLENHLPAPLAKITRGYLGR